MGCTGVVAKSEEQGNGWARYAKRDWQAGAVVV